MHNKKLIPVKDNKGLFRDEETGANSIVNTDTNQYSILYLKIEKKLSF